METKKLFVYWAVPRSLLSILERTSWFHAWNHKVTERAVFLPVSQRLSEDGFQPMTVESTSKNLITELSLHTNMPTRSCQRAKLSVWKRTSISKINRFSRPSPFYNVSTICWNVSLRSSFLLESTVIVLVLATCSRLWWRQHFKMQIWHLMLSDNV